ncbi:hypothetical protein Poli38472_008008 [Pythium oligandrum]|uniref:L-dopachrome isomerase n=1 Tax=Pythium oligandrum TaxID=41045 RepID=A0A8K1CMG5_PYTOL|nr:hypothetical protein Poli38472_008008 [Pythium oligandrum]|eukprot:TMW65366.1 hypothetical protein Poli38472_008008 [Pythium oligandrum]
MPLVKIITSAARAQVNTKSALAAFTSAVSQALDRPEEFVMVHLELEAAVSMKQSSEPCALINIGSFTSISREDNPKTIRMVTEVCEKELNVPAARVFVTLEQLIPVNSGINGEMIG